MVPVVGLDLRCGAGHLGLKHAAGMFPSALGFESSHSDMQKTKAPHAGSLGFLVPVVGLDLRCGAGHLGLKHAAGMFPSALGFESSRSDMQKSKAPLREALVFWCRWWDSNPHGVAPGGF